MDNQQRPDTYYLRNSERILSELESVFHLIEQAAAERFGTAFAASVTGSALRRFKSLLPSLPYIGGDDNFFPTQNLVFGAAMLCFYQEMQSVGKTAQETGRMVYEATLAGSKTQLAAAADPEQVEHMSAVHRQSETFSAAHPYPFGWQTTFIEGNDQDFTWGVDYTSCGIHTLFRQHGAEEFLPYLCFLDLPGYQARGIGLVRTKTLSHGADRCVFRFNLRGENRMEWYPDFYQQEDAS